MRGGSLAAYLGYPAAPPGAAHRFVQELAASRPASWVLARTLRHLDAGLVAASGGRLSASGVLAGAPVIRLSTVGARSGRRRDVMLVPVVTQRVFAVLGTNFGRRRAPGWVHNLLAHPRADLAYGRRTVAVHSRELRGQERAAVIAAAAAVTPAFERYQIRASHRQVYVFALEALPPGHRA
jgi:deazaflavin-dependent oxidoreductase (nitroreductase family)